MLIPDIIFNEQNVGTNPIRFGLRNRIGVVGEFTKGPANQFNYVNDFMDFAHRFGSDLAKGSMAVQAAFDQGAVDFGIVRVMGLAKEAFGSVVFAGVASKPNNLTTNVKYVGQAYPRYGTVLKTPIFTTGSYTGTDAGRYYFKVTAINSTTATVKYQFISLLDIPDVFGDPNIDWSAVSTSISVGLSTDKGVAKAISQGISLIFGTITQTSDIALVLNQEWSVRVQSFLFQTPIFKDATTSQVSTALMNTLSGNSPFGDIVRRDDDTGISFYLEEAYVGNAGNNFSYYFELQVPDGAVGSSASYNYSNSTTTITVTPTSNAGYISPGAIVTTNISGVLQSNTLVQSVNTSTGVITLNKSLDSGAGSGTATFSFSNSSGLSVTSFTSANTTFMSGGEDGPRTAFREFYNMNGLPILRLAAASVGGWGNSLKVSVYPLTASSFSLTVEDTNGDKYNPAQLPENYVIDLAEDRAIDENGFINALSTSVLIRGVFVPKYFNPDGYNAQLLYSSPQRIAPPDTTITDPTDPAHPNYYGPDYLREITLENGFDGPDITDADYIKAIDTMAEYPVHIILAAGQYKSRAVKQRLINQADKSHELEGLRIAITNTRPGLSPNVARQETSGFDSKRGVMITGWSTYAGQVNATRFGMAPDGLYAGKLAVIPVQVGPNARTTAGPVQSIFEVDTRFNSKASLQLYTDARLEILALDQTQAGFYFINGRTLSSGTAFEKVAIRRIYDLIRQDLFQNLQQYKSETNTPLLRSQIATSINAYLSSLTRGGQLANYLPAVIDSSNNTQEDYLAGRLNVQISFLPVYAADYIYITLVRNSTGGIQIGD